MMEEKQSMCPGDIDLPPAFRHWLGSRCLPFDFYSDVSEVEILEMRLDRFARIEGLGSARARRQRVDPLFRYRYSVRPPA